MVPFALSQKKSHPRPNVLFLWQHKQIYFQEGSSRLLGEGFQFPPIKHFLLMLSLNHPEIWIRWHVKITIKIYITLLSADIRFYSSSYLQCLINWSFNKYFFLSKIQKWNIFLKTHKNIKLLNLENMLNSISTLYI